LCFVLLKLFLWCIDKWSVHFFIFLFYFFNNQALPFIIQLICYDKWFIHNSVFCTLPRFGTTNLWELCLRITLILFLFLFLLLTHYYPIPNCNGQMSVCNKRSNQIKSNPKGYHHPTTHPFTRSQALRRDSNSQHLRPLPSSLSTHSMVLMSHSSLLLHDCCTVRPGRKTR